jgi:hypothetical protein
MSGGFDATPPDERTPNQPRGTAADPLPIAPARQPETPTAPLAPHNQRTLLRDA